MITLVKVSHVEPGLRIETHDSDGTVIACTIPDEPKALVFAAQLAEFFDADIEVDRLLGACGNFLGAENQIAAFSAPPSCT